MRVKSNFTKRYFSQDGESETCSCMYSINKSTAERSSPVDVNIKKEPSPIPGKTLYKAKETLKKV